VPGVTIEVLDEAAMKRENMGAILGVGQGSRRPPRMVLVHYRGAGGAPVALAGKGITFDSGGLSLKDGTGMSRMKGDMAGAAAAVGTVLALAKSRAPVNVVAVAALAENMPGGNAQRPGDVVRTMGGKTVEVLNTDAEGRLVLADAVQYVAAKHSPSAIVDIATLTGSVVGALGDEYAGLFARHEALGAALLDAGETSGEPVWRLPLHRNHYDDLKSDIADLKNVVEGGGPGASLGAAFIGSFVDEALPWAHVDMAGTMWASSALPTVPKGATGYGVRLLEEFVRGWAASR
jgi:leucyl aminopeptidase